MYLGQRVEQQKWQEQWLMHLIRNSAQYKTHTQLNCSVSLYNVAITEGTLYNHAMTAFQ